MTLADPPLHAVDRRFTPDDLMNLNDEHLYELVEGRLVEKGTDMRSNYVVAKLIGWIEPFLRERRLNHVVLAEEFFRCFPSKPEQVRRPDLALVLSTTLPGGQLVDSPVPFRPDVAVEVISKNDKVYDLEEKLEDYRDAAIPLVVLIYPATRKAKLLRDGREVGVVAEDGLLTLEPVLPGFAVRLGDVLPPRVAVVATPPTPA